MPRPGPKAAFVAPIALAFALVIAMSLSGFLAFVITFLVLTPLLVTSALAITVLCALFIAARRSETQRQLPAAISDEFDVHHDSGNWWSATE